MFLFYCFGELFVECVCYLSRCSSCSVVGYFGAFCVMIGFFPNHEWFSIVCTHDDITNTHVCL